MDEARGYHGNAEMWNIDIYIYIYIYINRGGHREEGIGKLFPLWIHNSLTLSSININVFDSIQMHGDSNDIS